MDLIRFYVEFWNAKPIFVSAIMCLLWFMTTIWAIQVGHPETHIDRLINGLFHRLKISRKSQVYKLALWLPMVPLPIFLFLFYGLITVVYDAVILLIRSVQSLRQWYSDLPD